jgi:uncharacterized protein YprB with RNaseH-like and TPR domain
MKNKEWQSKCLEMKSLGFSNRQIARDLFGKSSAESRIRRFLLSKNNDVKVKKETLKILFWDIETSIKRSWHFNQDGYLGSDLIDKDFFILTHAWQWNDGEIESTRISGEDASKENDFDVVLKAWSLLDNADIVVGHNLDKFDIKKINARFLKWGLQPPSSYKTIDTYKLAKRKFGLTFKSLKYLCEYLNLPVQKLPHSGVNLWINATLGDDDAIDDMVTYNRGDIPTLKMVFEKLMSWGTGATNIGYMKQRKEEIETILCPSCGSDDIEPLNKSAFTGVNSYQAYRCKSCKGVSRSNSVREGRATKLISI